MFSVTQVITTKIFIKETFFCHMGIFFSNAYFLVVVTTTDKIFLMHLYKMVYKTFSPRTLAYRDKENLKPK